VTSPTGPAAWRVAVTRDEPPGGPLGAALSARGFGVVYCPVLVEHPPDASDRLDAAARGLDRYDWVVVASARSVRAIGRARGGPWPAGLRTAAVGAGTAAAIEEAGVTRPAVVAPSAGADALVAHLSGLAWAGRRVLVPTTQGGRETIAAFLRTAGAHVDEVDAYVMRPRERADIAEDWRAAAPDAAVFASPRTAQILAEAVGADALRTLRAIVSIGATTATALDRLGVPTVVAPDANFAEAARAVTTAFDARLAR
jgi:uroporphyrinogen-III synthase